MNKTGWVLTAVSILIIVAAIILFILPAKTVAPTTDTQATTTPVAQIPDLIVVDSPRPNDTITGHKVTITGRARGTWYFEASFPIKITRDSDGATLVEAPAQAQGDWMTQDFVPFSITLDVGDEPMLPLKATIVLHNDNPSGLPENDKSLSIPVTFVR